MQGLTCSVFKYTVAHVGSLLFMGQRNGVFTVIYWITLRSKRTPVERMYIQYVFREVHSNYIGAGRFFFSQFYFFCCFFFHPSFSYSTPDSCSYLFFLVRFIRSRKKKLCILWSLFDLGLNVYLQMSHFIKCSVFLDAFVSLDDSAIVPVQSKDQTWWRDRLLSTMQKKETCPSFE